MKMTMIWPIIMMMIKISKLTHYDGDDNGNDRRHDHCCRDCLCRLD